MDILRDGEISIYRIMSLCWVLSTYVCQCSLCPLNAGSFYMEVTDPEAWSNDMMCVKISELARMCDCYIEVGLNQ